MENNEREIWNKCLQIIKSSINAQSFQTWFTPIIPLKIDTNVVKIQVPSHFFYEYLEEHYIDLLLRAFKEVLGRQVQVEYGIVVDSGRKPTKTHAAVPQSISVIPGKTAANTYQRQQFSTQAKNPQEPAIRNPFIIPGIQKINLNSQLNPNYTLDNFVEGECNRLGRSAAMEIAQHPGSTPFNPLMIFGESGLGKTHLAQAIGNAIKELYPEKLVLYVSANRFQTQYSDAVRSNNTIDFMHFYQMLDVLILDDVQEFAGKQRTQDTFFHIFNQLHQSGKQLILTSDCPPVELKGLTQRMLSRFKWGLNADLSIPDYKTRLEILQKKVYNDGMKIPQDVLEYIANTVVSNVRELEGALISLLAQSTLNRKEITLELAQFLLEKIVKKPKKEFSLTYMQKVVCEYFNMDPQLLQTKTRKREIVLARQLAMYFAKNLTNASLQSIGAQIGGRDHSTVLHACKTVADLIQTDKNFKNTFDELEKKLKY